MKTGLSFLSWLVAGALFAQTPQLVVPIGHTKSITSVAFSPDGKYVLTGSEDKFAKLWDLHGREIQSFSGHLGKITAVAFSSDGKYILTGSGDKTAKLWDLNGREIRTLSEHGAEVNAVAFSPDGKYMATGCGYRDTLGGTVRVWDLNGREIRSFKDDPTSSVAFSPDGQYIVAGSSNGRATLLDLNGRYVQSFYSPSWTSSLYEVEALAFSPDGKYILTGSADNTAKLWDLNGQEIQVFSGHTGDINSVSFSPDGKYVLTGSDDGTAKLWELSGREVQTYKGHSVAFSPDSKYVLTRRGNKTATLWDLQGREIRTFTGHAVEVRSPVFSPDSKYILTGSSDKSAKLWDLQGRKIQAFTGHTDIVVALAFSPDGKYILTGSRDSTVKLWDLQGRQLRTFTGHNYLSSVVFSPDGQYILAESSNNTAKLLDLNGREVQVFAGHKGFIVSLAFSPNGEYILVGASDGAKLWDLEGHAICTFLDKTGSITSIAFSPDGKYVLTGSSDNTAKLWYLSGREIRKFVGHTGNVESVAFSPDGKYVLTRSDDGVAKLWDLDGNEIQTISCGVSEQSSAVFSPDGRYILTDIYDNTLRLWSAATGQEIAALTVIDSTDWVVTTPSGLFDASPGAMKLMHFVQGIEAISLDQLKERYYEPGLLAKIMGFDRDELRNVSAFEQIALYPEVKAGIEKDLLALELTERNGGLGKLSLFINDKEVQEDINPKRLKNLSIDLQTFAKYYQTDTLNTIALRSYNQEGWLKSQAYELAYLPAGGTKAGRPANSPGIKTIPHLYALVVGTSNYSGEKLDLRFADLDAAAMSQALRDAGSALFGADHTSVHLLSSTLPAEPCAKTNIRQAFANIAAKATPADVLVIYFSGHGLAYGEAEKAQFYYLTKDIGNEDLSDPEVRNNFTISSDEFTKWLTAIPAQKQVMILDACNAGKVVESLAALAQKSLDPSQIRALDRMKDRTGMFILTGSAADKVSYEASQYGQGLLTYSLLQGMSGLALTEDKRVDVMTLFQYARDKVPELAKGIGGVQTPVLAFPAGGASFDIGIVHAGVKIPVAVGKPVFIRNVFQDEASFDDVLGLTDALEKYFQEITAKGAQAALIYVDVKEYENAYSMKGLYHVTGEVVAVRGRLFKGKESQGEFQVTGKKSDVPGLVGVIVEKVSGMIK